MPCIVRAYLLRRLESEKRDGGLAQHISQLSKKTSYEHNVWQDVKAFFILVDGNPSGRLVTQVELIGHQY